jgi:hypothetical protein
MADVQDRYSVRCLPGNPGSFISHAAPRAYGRATGEATAVIPALPVSELEPVLDLVRRLVRSNLDSIHLSKELLAAQELADARASRVPGAIDDAAASDADPEAIDAAVCAAVAAEDAKAEELSLSTAWARQRVEVYELAVSAITLLGRLPGQAGANAELLEETT